MTANQWKFSYFNRAERIMLTNNRKLVLNSGVEVRVAGIPALALITLFERPRTYNRFARWEDTLPDEPAVVEFELFDRKGYPAPWLERKMTQQDQIEVEDTLFEHIRMCSDD